MATGIVPGAGIVGGLITVKAVLFETYGCTNNSPAPAYQPPGHGHVAQGGAGGKATGGITSAVAGSTTLTSTDLTSAAGVTSGSGGRGGTGDGSAAGATPGAGITMTGTVVTSDAGGAIPGSSARPVVPSRAVETAA